MEQQEPAPTITDEPMYHLGSDFAQRVQKGLAQGKSFEEMIAPTPTQAARNRDVWRVAYTPLDHGMMAWYDGYLSRWD
jgi:hypothetical protein